MALRTFTAPRANCFSPADEFTTNGLRRHREIFRRSDDGDMRDRRIASFQPAAARSAEQLNQFLLQSVRWSREYFEPRPGSAR